MTPDQFRQIGETLGVPAAIAACLLIFGFIALMQAIKGVKWIGERMLGEAGLGTKLVDRHVRFMDSVEHNDSKHTESLDKLTDSTLAISGCLEHMTKTQSQQHADNVKMLGYVHEDVKVIKDKVTRT
jgi:hypothetical protein